MHQPTRHGSERWDLLGIPVVVATADQAIAQLDAGLRAGLRQQVAFLNAHTSNVAAADPEFAAVLRGFVVLNDGIGVDLAARWVHGERFPENLNGTDFVPKFLRTVQRPLRVHLLGARPGVAEAAGERLSALAPQHTLVGVRDGYFAPEEVADVVAEVRAAAPDVLLVALGNPAQEKFLAEHADALGVPLAFGVGALFDFLAGRVERAPGWVRSVRAEWLWRLVQEPGRLWRRYLLGTLRFLLRVAGTPRRR